MVEQLTVELGERSYPIVFFGGADAGVFVLEKIRQTGRSVTALADSKVWDLHFPKNDDLLCLKIEGGEASKSITCFDNACEFLATNRIARDGGLIAIGGGVVGDLAGFVAASYLRGIDFYQVPTTLLAMVDSSVGGKTGINIKAGKNLVGAFWQPQVVYICTEFLKTLPPEEFSAGMAEVIKYGMLYDAKLFDQLEALEHDLTWDHPELSAVVRRCCEIKAEIVKADEKETASSGGRALLNLGHTFAHAIENVAGYGTYLHGEAVAIGLVLAAKLSVRLVEAGRSGFAVSDEDVIRCHALIERYRLPTDLRISLHRVAGDLAAPKLSIEALLDAMRRDKKVRSGKLRFVAMEKIGNAVTVDDIPEGWIRDIWSEAGAE
ncbi:3-dehydroquinate synthase [Rubellicoccus peritrichatus]|uniref:3-dehydroquinate synthase n=1 Tax=Rubellicoccus peritrichatus TaxID=3080537 RepID=A0AAQ3LEW4_9BACT|nr:3-dehydroquinate synthase [Puniceicoccus sp. CR14]WOO42655.1 3-dehydroquinate synthase [Puniceicoccus sp. CR14]